MKAIASSLFLLMALTLLLAPSVRAQVGPGAGSFSFTVNGLTVQGQLSNVILYADNSVTMTMSVDEDLLQTPIGPLPLRGSGQWYGAVASGGTLWGTIENIKGTAEICAVLSFPILSCAYAEFIGNGVWVGTLSGSQGTGTLQGVITFTSFPYPQSYRLYDSSNAPIIVGQPIPMTGTWNSTFQPSS